MPYAVAVTITINPADWDGFLPLMEANAAASLQSEVGCRQFDICTDTDTPNQVFLYEVYTDRAAFEAHLASAHYATFVTATKTMITDKTARTFRAVRQ